MMVDTGKLPLLLSKRQRQTKKMEAAQCVAEKKGAAARMWCSKRSVGERVRLAEDGLKQLDVMVDDEITLKRSADNEVGLNYLVLLRDFRACNTAKQLMLEAGAATTGLTAPLPQDLNRQV